MNRKIKNIIVILLSAYILILSIMFILGDKRDFSEAENRRLSKCPSISFKAIRSGKYMKALEDYFSDQFPRRDSFMGIKTEAELLAGKKEINNIFVLDDGRLIKNYKRPENTELIINQLRKFEEKIDRDTYLLLVPTAVELSRDLLPKYAPIPSQIDEMEKIYKAVDMKKVPIYEELKEFIDKGGKAYYRTDHHWTSKGAYCGYKAFRNAMGKDIKPLSEFEEIKGSSDFKGSIYSKLDYGAIEAEDIMLYKYKDHNISVYYPDKEKVEDTIYNMDYLNKKDKYSVFLDNVNSFVEIINESTKNKEELAIIKDSYANSMIQFLLPHYHKIYVFDCRSYKMGPSKFIKEHENIKDVLILYNMNTIDQDTGIRGIY